MQLTLTRDAPRPDCQEGILTVGTKRYFTMERPWFDDKPEISCVPTGYYALIPHTVIHGLLEGLETYALENSELHVYAEPPSADTDSNVRVAILIHPANWAFQLEGCIAPGKARGLLMPPGASTMEPAVLSSKDAFQEILVALGGPGQSGHSVEIS